MATIRLDSFRGINNRAHVGKSPDGFLRKCVNFRIDNAGMLVMREGYDSKAVGGFSALWSDNLRCFAVLNGDLVEIDNNYNATVLLSGIGYRPISFCEADGRYFFVCKNAAGVIDLNGVKTLGMVRVNYQPTLTAVNGVLAAGRYLVAVTGLDSDGFESGTKESAVIVLTADKSIALSNIFVSTDPRVTEIAIYCSTCDGETLYRVGTVENGVTEFVISHVNDNWVALMTQDLSPAPLGDLICYHYGRLFIADGNELYYSQPWQYEHWDLREYLSYASAITALMPCEDGIWVTADGLYWVSGKDTEELTQVKKHSARVFKGSEKLIPPEHLSLQGYFSSAWVCMSDAGLLLLMAGGAFLNVSSDAVKLPRFSRCAGALIERDDWFGYVAVLNGADVPLNTI